MVMTSVCQKSICIFQNCRNKGFMFTIKEVWHRVCSPENQSFNISSWKWPSTSSLKSFIWFWWGIDELLPVYFSSHQHVQHMTPQILLILIDCLATFLSEITLFLNFYNFGTGRDIKKRETVIFLIFAALSNSGIKKPHFICTLNRFLINEKVNIQDNLYFIKTCQIPTQ